MTEEPAAADSHVTRVPLGKLQLPAELASGPAARRFAVAQLPSLVDDDRDTLALLVSEVVTNALLHARSAVTLSLLLLDDGRRLRVEVADDAEALPSRHDHGEDASTGRGMHLVDALCDSWGATPRPGGKTVWFELVLTDPGMPR